MKKITLLVAVALSSGFIFGQSQRLVLVEEYTQASCPPCAAQNPALNSLLQANLTKATSIKYQTDWPGTDPMNAQNPAEVSTRVSYYGVTGVPECHQDGAAGVSPSGITQSGINTEYAVASPFSMVLKHWFNAANDSIFVYCEATCSQNVTMTTPKLRIGLVEKTITFTSPPGTNGEMVFENVMRKMYPDASGTSMATTWTTGQKKTVSFKAKIPTYIYDKTELALVAWIQDDGNKNVKQAGYDPSPSTPLALPPVADFLAGATTSCDGIIKFQDQSAMFPKTWLWDFGDGGASSAQNPTHKYNASGTYSVQLTAGNANGTNSVTKTGYITITLSGNAPTGVSDNICSNGVANLSATPSGSGALNWYNAAGAMVHTGTTYAPTIVGTTDFWVAEMTANTVKSEGAATNAIGAGTTYSAQATQGLIFDVLKPCTLQSVVCYASSAGNRTIQVVDGGGNVLQSATVNIPNGTSTVTLNFALDPGTGYVIKPSTLGCNLYRNTAGGVYPYNVSGVVKITGNTASQAAYYYFFYDWKVLQNPCASPSVKVSGIDTCTSTGIHELAVTNSLAVNPNPSNGAFTTSFNATAGNYLVKISNTLGQVVYEEALNNFSGTYSKEINIASFGKGVYLLNISNGKNEDVKKIITF
jgi:PKD repeat protein